MKRLQTLVVAPVLALIAAGTGLILIPGPLTHPRGDELLDSFGKMRQAGQYRRGASFGSTTVLSDNYNSPPATITFPHLTHRDAVVEVSASIPRSAQTVTDGQVRKMMEESTSTGAWARPPCRRRWTAGRRASTSRPASCRPTISAPHDWRTRSDPFEEHWAELCARLRERRGCRRRRVRVARGSASRPLRPGQLRTLQRR